MHILEWFLFISIALCSLATAVVYGYIIIDIIKHRGPQG